MIEIPNTDKVLLKKINKLSGIGEKLDVDSLFDPKLYGGNTYTEIGKFHHDVGCLEHAELIKCDYDGYIWTTLSLTDRGRYVAKYH